MAETKQKQLDYIKDYNKSHYVIIRVQVNRTTEPELLSHLITKTNKSGYIKDLILQDMKK